MVVDALIEAYVLQIGNAITLTLLGMKVKCFPNTAAILILALTWLFWF